MPRNAQLEAGLRARRALVDAKKAESYPDIYAGLAVVLLRFAPGLAG